MARAAARSFVFEFAAGTGGDWSAAAGGRRAAKGFHRASDFAAWFYPKVRPEGIHHVRSALDYSRPRYARAPRRFSSVAGRATERSIFDCAFGGGAGAGRLFFRS